MREGAAARTLFFVWGAMVASILAYGIVAILVLRSGRPSSAGSGVDLWLEIEAAGTAWAALVLWKMRRNDPIRSGALDPDSAGGRAALRRVSIVCWALVESIAIFGLVLVVLRRTAMPGTIFLAGSLALQLLFAPRTPSRTGGR